MSAPQPYRLALGGRIDRQQPLAFRFNHRAYAGYAGDTLASALLANGVHFLGRSSKFHRPRGVLSAGIEEPNALVTVGAGPWLEGSVRATLLPLTAGLEARSQNCWPSLHFDLARVNDFLSPLFPAGFYNKIFKWPRWEVYEPLIRRIAGLAPAPVAADPDRYATRNAHCEVLVVGSGPAGLAAAAAAAATGVRVMLVEQDVEIGGSLLWEPALQAAPVADWFMATRRQLEAADNVVILRRATCAGFYDGRVLTVAQRLRDSLPAAGGQLRECFWRIRARRVVLATGAIEQPLPFERNDVPGVLLAGAARHYLQRYAVLAGRRVVVVANNDSAQATAQALCDAGAEVAGIVDTRSGTVRSLAARGGRRVRGLLLRSTSGRRQHIDCDAIAMSGGSNPALHLFRQAGGRLRYDAGLGALAPDPTAGGVDGVAVVGAAAGHVDLALALESAVAAGRAAAGDRQPSTARLFLPSLPASPAARPPGRPGEIHGERAAKIWIDYQHDVTAADVAMAVDENYVSVEHLKRYTTNGMSVDQGKTSNLNALALLAQRTGRSIDATGTTTFRPPYSPVTFGAMAGGRLGSHYRPRRELPARAAHEDLQARFEDYGGWERPAVYAAPGESESVAIQREALAVRQGVGLFDASPLGKLLVRGVDAGEFLNRIYYNDLRGLAVGRSRYGLMLNEQGVVIDDGICARFDEQEYWVSTTSGGAARIGAWLEEWLQCEWTDLEVVVTPVTAQWATLTLAGPQARAVLGRLDSDFDLSPTALPHLGVRSGRLCGMPCRLLRVSFTGELSFEINVPADAAQSLWQALLDAGREHGIAPFGIEALMALRIEKGYLHVGSDTDGTTVPADLGYGGVLARKTGDFVGRRSLLLPANRDADRLQLVGLRPCDRALNLPAGAHLLDAPSGGRAAITSGYVTSACHSPTLGHAIGLGRLRRGRERLGTTVTVHDLGREWSAEVVPPVFHDPDGVRLRG